MVDASASLLIVESGGKSDSGNDDTTIIGLVVGVGVGLPALCLVVALMALMGLYLLRRSSSAASPQVDML